MRVFGRGDSKKQLLLHQKRQEQADSKESEQKQQQKQQDESVVSVSTVEIQHNQNSSRTTMSDSDAHSKQESRRSGRSGRSNNHQQQQQQLHSNKPVDLDDLKFAEYEDTSSDASVGDVTETSVSKSSNDGVISSCGSPQEDNRMSALVHTMAAKQHGISETFCDMIGKMSKMMVQMEEQMVLHMDCAEDDEHANKAKSKAHRSVQKALEMQDNALAMKAKQARIAQQFETLVHRLEQETTETAHHNQSLKRQLQMAKVLLKDEAGVEMEDISETASLAYSVGRPHTPRSSSSSSKRPPLSHHHRKAGSVRSSQSSPEKSAASPMHPIKEIAFSNTVVDVTEMSSQAAAAAAEREETASMTAADGDDAGGSAADPLVLKEMTSSESPIGSQKTGATTSTSATTTTTSSENLRILL